MRSLLCPYDEQLDRPYAYQRPVDRPRRAIRSLFSLGVQADFYSGRFRSQEPVPSRSSGRNVYRRELPPVRNPPSIDFSKIGKSSSWSDSYLCAIKHLAHNIKKSTIEIISRFLSPVKRSSETVSRGRTSERTEDTYLLPSRFMSPVKRSSKTVSSESTSENTSSRIVPEATASTSDSTNQGKRKRLVKTATNDGMPKRVRHFSPEILYQYKPKDTSVQNPMSAGHFSAWGVEDDEIRYYMKKDIGGCYRYSRYIARRKQQKAPKSPERIRNSRDRMRGFTISPYRMFATKDKPRHFATWMRSTSKTNPAAYFYSYYDEKDFKEPEEPCPEKTNSAEMWTCDTCLFLNKVPSERCWVCDVIKYGVMSRSTESSMRNELSSNKRGVHAQQTASVGDASTSSGLSDIEPPRPKPRPVGILMGQWARRRTLPMEGDCMDPEFTCPTFKPPPMKPELVKALNALLNQRIHYNWFLYH
ncbi:uncharacterized protein LOC119967580 isoform X2 [Scyliorhinus canicula]|uniref:uncharacterized protein LOC119967580 isoform X2 n=1 Tax=Scyliorhinus canicula TaxID=7830 RepID=UPI0018F5C8D6|nr:uncharacterized protein LOC119967580 isoform X2 [Scyliorhinus canicula]